MDWFYDNGLRHERVNGEIHTENSVAFGMSLKWSKKKTKIIIVQLAGYLQHVITGWFSQQIKQQLQINDINDTHNERYAKPIDVHTLQPFLSSAFT